jgi:hypothetical protein
MHSHRIHLLILIILALIITGCSSASLNPSIPSNNTSQLTVAVSDLSPDGTPLGGVGTLGLFQVTVDTMNLKAELAPIRTLASADVLEVVDMTNFLQLAPCTDCVDIRSVSLDDDGNLVLSIGIKHPFPAGDMFKPISGRNRGDLHVFNVEGTIISETTGQSYSALGTSLSDAGLLNADGFSPYLDPMIDQFYPTEANVHPYITHFDDYSTGNYDPLNPMGFESVTNPPPSGYLVMAMGCNYDYKDYVFKPSGGQMAFIYAVGCTYAVSADSKILRFTPEYRCPQHNKKSASEVSVEIHNNALSSMDPQSTADIEVHVVDINHGVPVGTGLGEMRTDSSVDDIFIEIPQVMTSLLVLDGNNPVSGTGHSPADPLIYTGVITNSALAGEGVYFGLVKVTDSYSTGLNESPLLNGMDGIERVDPTENPLSGLFAITQFATYQSFILEIFEGNTPPTALLTSLPDPATIAQGYTIMLDASGSSDAEDSISDLTFAYIFNYDGNPDSFDTPDYEAVGETSVVTDPYNTAGNYVAAVKVTDTGGLWDIDTIDVTVIETSNVVVYANYNEMYKCNPDHTGKVYLGPGMYPCLSQSNNVIVYCQNSTYNIRAMNVDGTNDRLVASGNYRYPSVSANGTTVSFYDNENPSKCFRCDIDGSNLVQISPDDGSSWRYAQVSGDGSKIVILRYTSPYDIYVCNGDGSGLTLVKSDAGYPQITYDGQWIFYETAFQIRKVRANGTEDQFVIGQSATSRFSINPDASKITYCQYYSTTGNDVHVYDTISGVETRLTYGGHNAGEKTLTTDGQWVIGDAFAVGGLFSVQTNGTGSVIEWNEGDDPSCHGVVAEHY